MTSHGWTNKCRKINYQFSIGFVLVVFVLGSILSCIPYKNIDFQALRPAQIKLDRYDKVDILCEYCKDSTPIMFMDSISRNNARVSLNFVYTLRDNLQKSPLFQNAKFSLVSADSLLISLKNYKERRFNNSLIIILDSIYIKDTVMIQRIPHTTDRSYTFGIIHKFGCRTYNKKDMALLDNFLLQDTVFWPSQYSEYELLMSIPEFSEAIWDTGIKAGEKYAHYLAPYWIEQSRNFYLKNNKAFKNAFELVQKDLLDSAISVLNSGTKKEKRDLYNAKILFNQAIIYELKDNIDSALFKADSSLNTHKSKISEDYVKRLRLRKLDKMALDWQLN